MEAQTVPSHLQLGRDKKVIQTRVCLTPSCHLSHQVIFPHTVLSPDTQQKPSQSPTPRTTGLARKSQDAQSIKTSWRAEAERKDSTLWDAAGTRMGNQGLLRGNRPRTQQGAELWAMALTSWVDAAKLIHSGHQPGPVENLERKKKVVSTLQIQEASPQVEGPYSCYTTRGHSW